MNTNINYEFNNLKFFEAYNLLKKILLEINGNNTFESEYQAKLILAYASGGDISKIIGLRWNEQIPEETAREIDKITKRRIKNEPLQYIIGETEFYGRRYKVCPDVLIPRGDTECIVSEAVDFLSETIKKNLNTTLKIIDIGTGSGAIAVTIACEMIDKNNKLEIYAADISENALKVASENAELNLCADKIKFIKSDIYSFFENTDLKFDLIISNPPYISETEYVNLRPEIFFEPKNALTAPDNGTLFYKKIFKDAALYLNEGGSVICEFGFGMYDEIEKITTVNNFKNIKKIYDIERRIRGVKVWA